MAIKWLWFSFLVDPLLILVMGCLGVFLSSKIKNKHQKVYSNISEYSLKVVALTAAVVGISAFQSVFTAGASGKSMILMAFITIVVGTLIGTWSNFDEKLENWIDRKWNKSKAGNPGKFTRFISLFDDGKQDKTKTFGWAAAYATYVSIVGVLSIMGPIHEATDGVLSFIIMKTVLDTVATIVFAMSWGPGVILSAVFVLIWQVLWGLPAPFLSGILSGTVISFADGVGGLIIMAMGLSVSGILKGNDGKSFRVGNLFPAMLLAFIVGYLAVKLNIFW